MMRILFGIFIENEDLYIGYYFNNQVKSLSLFEKTLRDQLKEEYLKRKEKWVKIKIRLLVICK